MRNANKNQTQYAIGIVYLLEYIRINSVSGFEL